MNSFSKVRLKSLKLRSPELPRPNTALRAAHEAFAVERLRMTPFAVVLAEPLPESTLRSSFTLKELQFRRSGKCDGIS